MHSFTSTRKWIGRVSLAGIAAAAALLASSTVATADTVNFAPVITVGHGLYSDQVSACVGYVDVRAGSDYDAPYPPNYVKFTPHFIGVSRVCSVSGTIDWRNLDTGQSGSRQWALSGWDGPSTYASIETGPGRVDLTITTTTPHISSSGQFHAS
nr:hypothetical protein [Rhodococcus sp. (in: high G+C Gram-positive bacteria)]